MRACRFGVATTLCLGVFCGQAVAEEFSILCNQGPGAAQLYFTFDDQNKRVVGYNFTGAHVGGPIFTGAISAISAEEIQFGLSVYYNSNMGLGNFALNRKDGWLKGPSGSGQPGTCHPIPLRTVMDLWEIFPHDPLTADSRRLAEKFGVALEYCCVAVRLHGGFSTFAIAVNQG
jgi:hypothetical protein